MMCALLAGGGYPPPGVPDTAANRLLWEDIRADLATMKAAGIQPDVPPE